MKGSKVFAGACGGDGHETVLKSKQRITVDVAESPTDIQCYL